jgi:hypothetical protein
MKKLHLNILLLMALVATAALPACDMAHCVHGSGNKVTETRKVKDFTKIKVDGDFKIILKQDSSLNLNISADDNIMKIIETNITGDRLHIHTKEHICSGGEITIIIGVRNLEGLKASGAIEVSTDGNLKVKDIDFDLAGANKLTLDLNANNVTTSGSGATEINLKGQATSHKINTSGVGKLNALDFVVGSCDIASSGASECKVNVLQTLNISSRGATSVKYKGHPTITQDKSGALSVEPVD